MLNQQLKILIKNNLYNIYYIVWVQNKKVEKNGH